MRPRAFCYGRYFLHFDWTKPQCYFCFGRHPGKFPNQRFSSMPPTSSLPSSGTETVAPGRNAALASTTETNALKAVTEAAKPSDGKPAQMAGATPSPTAETQQAAAPAEMKPAVKSSLFGSNTQPKQKRHKRSQVRLRLSPVRTSLFGSSTRTPPAPQPAQPQETQQSTAADKDGAKPTNAKAGDAAETNTEQAATPKGSRRPAGIMACSSGSLPTTRQNRR